MRPAHSPNIAKLPEPRHHASCDLDHVVRCNTVAGFLLGAELSHAVGACRSGPATPKDPRSPLMQALFFGAFNKPFEPARTPLRL
jgi:hypothetical protein